MKDPTDTQAQDVEAATHHVEAKRKAQQQADDLKWLMRHPQGRRIVTRIFEKTGIRRTPFNTSGSVMSFNAGMQNIGLWLEAEILEATPDDYLRLLKEFRSNDD